MKPAVIAIDGPAGSGKSTIGRALAEYLGYAMLDSGLLYRLIAQQALSQTAIIDAEVSNDFIIETAKRTLKNLKIQSSDEGSRLIFEDHPLADLDLHSDKISSFVPLVGRVSEVRVLVRKIQQQFTESGYTILAGRDIGTVVVPQAELKLYLDVSLEERVARRQWAQNQLSAASRLAIERALSERDKMDRDRAVSPLRVATDAVVFRTDKLSVEETVLYIMQMCDLQPISSHKEHPRISQEDQIRLEQMNDSYPQAETRNIGEHSSHGVKGRNAQYVVGGYVVDTGRVLLMWHSQLGRWVPCGGRIRIPQGEYPHEAVAREVEAECGLQIEIVRPAGASIADHISSPLPMPAAMQEIRLSSGDYYLDMVYFCRVIGGDLVLDYRQARAYHWFDVNDLQRYPLLPHVQQFSTRALNCGPLGS